MSENLPQPTAQNALLTNIRELLNQGRKQVFQAVNAAMVQTYWEIGRLIVEDEQQGQARAEYGKGVLKTLSTALTNEFGKGFDVRNLSNMRSFYQAYPIWNAVRTELSWTHYRTLLKVENEQARQWYINEAIQQAWSARALERQIGVLYYERLLATQAKQQDIQPVLAEGQQKTTDLALTAKDYLRDPYIFDFLGLPSAPLQESELEQALIDNLQQFLLELGKGFAFVERQQRINTDDGDYFIDLVFYNFHLKCFLLIDLKMHKLTHQDVGQMDMYIRMYDELKKAPDDNPTLGIVLCSETDEDIARYSILHGNEQLFASKYKLYLPTEEELREEIETQKAIFYLQQKDAEEAGGEPNA